MMCNVLEKVWGNVDKKVGTNAQLPAAEEQRRSKEGHGVADERKQGTQQAARPHQY
jgi:hypothetical protein